MTVAGALLAHAGPGATWQAMVVVAAVALAAAVLLGSVGVLRVERPDDLVLPLALAAVASSLAPLGDAWISDGIGWGLPLGVVSLAALVLAALTPLDLRLPGPLAMGALAMAAVTSVVLYPPLTAALHPPAEVLPLSDDAEVAITAPADGSQVPAGTVDVVVAVTGGSIGPGGVALEALPDDPEEAGELAVALARVRDDGTSDQQQRLEVTFDAPCTLADPCTRVGFEVELPAGGWELTVELQRGDGTPLAPPVRDRVRFRTG